MIFLRKGTRSWTSYHASSISKTSTKSNDFHILIWAYVDGKQHGLALPTRSSFRAVPKIFRCHSTSTDQVFFNRGADQLIEPSPHHLDLSGPTTTWFGTVRGHHSRPPHSHSTRNDVVGVGATPGPNTSRYLRHERVPMRCTPMRCMPMRCAPISEMHAYE